MVSLLIIAFQLIVVTNNITRDCLSSIVGITFSHRQYSKSSVPHTYHSHILSKLYNPTKMSIPSMVNIKALVTLFLVFAHLICVAKSESFSSSFDSNSLGQAFEFKIHIDAGKEECFYQQIEKGASLYVAFHVIRGADSEAGFFINNPLGQTVMPYIWKQSAEFDEATVHDGGYYTMCIDNKPSRFASKLVSMYVASFKRAEWDEYIQELTNADLSVTNTTNMLRNVDQNINSMVNYLEFSKQQHSYDWYLVESNNRYVQNWSIVQCVVIVIAGLVQVYFVRKLFSMEPSGAKGFRGRA